MAPENRPQARREAESDTGQAHARRLAIQSSAYRTTLDAYAAHLDQSPLRGHSKRTYLSAIRLYLQWLEAYNVAGDPLEDPQFRDRAVSEYAIWLRTVAKRSPATTNKAMAALDDFYLWKGMGKCGVRRSEVTPRVPHVLDTDNLVQYLRAAETCGTARDRAIALLPFYVGARVAEIAALNVGDVPEIRGINESNITDESNANGESSDANEFSVTDRPSDTKNTTEKNEKIIEKIGAIGPVRLASAYGRQRTVPTHPSLWRALSAWLAEHPSPVKSDSPLFLSRLNKRMTTDALSDIISVVARAARLDDPVTASALRHTFEAYLIREETPSEVVSYLVGHSRRKAACAENAPYGDKLIAAIASLPSYAEPKFPSAASSPDPADLAVLRNSQLEIISELAVTNPEDPERQRDLATARRKRGGDAAAAGELDTARNEYEDSLRIAVHMATSNPSSIEWQLDLAIIHFELGDVMAEMAAKDLSRARDCYQESLNIITELAAADSGNPRWQKEMQMIRQRIATAGTPHYSSRDMKPDTSAEG